MNLEDLLKSYQNRIKVIGGGNLSKHTLPPPTTSKSIVPDRCEFCGIGIGQSIQKENGVWKNHKHIHQEYFEYTYRGRVFKVCEWCYEDMVCSISSYYLFKPYLEECKKLKKSKQK